MCGIVIGGQLGMAEESGETFSVVDDALAVIAELMGARRLSEIGRQGWLGLVRKLWRWQNDQMDLAIRSPCRLGSARRYTSPASSAYLRQAPGITGREEIGLGVSFDPRMDARRRRRHRRRG